MKFSKFSWIFPLATIVGIFVGYQLFPLAAFTPEMSGVVAVATGLRPAASLFPGLWRHIAKTLPSEAWAYGLLGRSLATVFGLLFYCVLRRAMVLLHRSVGDEDRLENFFIPSISLVCAVMASFAEPVWRAFVAFAPASLTLLFAILNVHLYLGWIERGGWWRLCGGMLLTGMFAGETPIAFLFPPLFSLGYWLLWREIRGGGFVPRMDLPPMRALPVWRMFLSFLAGLGLTLALNLQFVSSHELHASLGWNFTYIIFHYGEQYLAQIRNASTVAGWLLGVSLCVIPFAVVVKLVPRLTDDDFPMHFFLGVIALFSGTIAYFEQGPFRGGWFWTWIGEHDIVSSGALLGLYSMLATCAFAFMALIFVADAFNPRRSEARESGVVISYRWSMILLTVFIASLLVMRLPHSNVRRILAFNDAAVKEIVRELNGAKWLFTDGTADAEIELEAARQGGRVYTVDLMATGAANAEPMRLRGLVDEGDVIAAKMGASALLRVWACDKPNGMDDAALQLGLELWKREKSMTPPPASAFLARTKGLREEDVRDAAVIAKTFADLILDLTAVANAPDVQPSVRDLFFAISWRLSRFARYRKDAEIADKLDSMNTALKRMLRDLEYARLQVFLQMTPKEGLELALKRADFQDAARYASAVLKIDEDDPRGNFGMGMYFLMANRYHDAEPFLRRVLVKRPDEPAVINNLSILCRKTRRYDEAVKLAERALELLPGNEEVEQTLRDAVNKAP